VAIGAAITAGAALVGAAKTGYDLYQSEKQGDLYKGASAEQKLGWAKSQSMADRLGMGTGLTEGTYSRIIEGGSEAAGQEMANVMALARESTISPLALDAITKKAMADSRLRMAETQERAEQLDIEAVIQQASQALDAQASASAQAGAMQKANEKALYLQRKIDEQRDRQFASTIGNLTKAMGIAGKYMDAEDVFDPDDATFEEEDKLYGEDVAATEDIEDDFVLDDLDAGGIRPFTEAEDEWLDEFIAENVEYDYSAQGED